MARPSRTTPFRAVLRSLGALRFVLHPHDAGRREHSRRGDGNEFPAAGAAQQQQLQLWRGAVRRHGTSASPPRPVRRFPIRSRNGTRAPAPPHLGEDSLPSPATHSQEIKMYWGKSGVGSESSGTGVFNAANGYASVIHMNETRDRCGRRSSPRNSGTSLATGTIGKGRNFTLGKGIHCGTNDHRPFRPVPLPHSDASLVPGQRGQLQRSWLGHRAESGQGGDAIDQPAAHQHGLCRRRQCQRNQHPALWASGSRRPHLSEQRGADLCERGSRRQHRPAAR